MSGSTRSRQKRKLEPISLEELAGTTGMSGFCTFLTRDSAVPVPALDGAEPSTPESSAPESTASVPAAPVPAASDNSAPESIQAVIVTPSALESTACERSAPETGAPKRVAPYLTAPEKSASELIAWPITSAPESTAPESDLSESSALGTFRRRIRIREAATVQDGHSLAEQAVYDAMYRAGRPAHGDSRILTIGLRTLAELSRMAYSNCKANVRSLVAKLAIDEQPGFSYTEGRTYVVYSFREILRRRKAAGLTHVVRNRGVAFVDPISGRELSASESGAVESRALSVTAVFSTASAPEPDKSGAPPASQSSALAPSALIENRHLLRNTGEASSSVPPGIVAALRRHIPDVDDDAALDLWSRCRENAPDARVEEVAWFIDAKAGKPGIRMPLGFLLTAVPKCFKGDSFRQFRDERERSRQSATDRERLFAAEILRSPDADEEQRQWAMELLGNQ